MKTTLSIKLGLALLFILGITFGIMTDEYTLLHILSTSAFTLMAFILGIDIGKQNKK